MTPWTWHGGGITAARRHFGGDDWLDLSTGINPVPWPGVDTLHFDWQALPAPEDLRALEAVAAAYFGVDSQFVCAVPGTEIGLRLIGQSLNGVRTAHVAPSYRTHGEMVAGSIATQASRSDAAEALILANPNNPDGRLIDTERLLAQDRPWLLVDEAFVDPDPDRSVAAQVADRSGLIVFRSFGKFFGLAGIRLGFVLARPEILADLRSVLGAWPLSAAALAIGRAAYQDHAWIEQTRTWLWRQAAALDAVLEDCGFSAIGACPLFRLITVDDGHALFERLARRAILTRPFAEQPHWLRLGLPADTAGLERLRDALRG